MPHGDDHGSGSRLRGNRRSEVRELHAVARSRRTNRPVETGLEETRQFRSSLLGRAFFVHLGQDSAHFFAGFELGARLEERLQVPLGRGLVAAGQIGETDRMESVGIPRSLARAATPSRMASRWSPSD